ncbi:MAG: acetate--CoA ligase family protein, partial [Chloroflexi bacterium]|nr:acetate--CoA ligase family protein [Chloroflexota bacterium]
GATRRRGDPLRGGKRVKGKRAKLRFPLFPFSPLPLTESVAPPPTRRHEDVADGIELVLMDAGVRLPRQQLCRSAEEAVAAAEAIGFPVVAKGIAPELPHKMDVGAVVLGVGDAAAVRDAQQSISRAVARAGGTLGGVLIQEMIDGAPAIELAVGIIFDPQWGPALMLAMGGTSVEALGLAAWRLCPLAEWEVDTMIAEIRGLDRLLGGYRGRPALDRRALCRAVARLSQATADLPTGGVEINPLVVLPEGEGTIAVDVRLG